MATKYVADIGGHGHAQNVTIACDSIAAARLAAAACRIAGNGLTAIRAALAHRVRELRELSKEAHEKQAMLASGNADGLYFYPDAETASTFNDGAGSRVIVREARA